MAKELCKSADRAVRLMGPYVRNAAVLIEVDKLNAYGPSDEQDSIGVAMAATVVFKSERLPSVVYRNPWPVTSVESLAGRVGEQLERRLRVPPGLLQLPPAAYHAIRTSLMKVRSFALRETWRQDAGLIPTARGSAVASKDPSNILSPAASHLLDALDAPDTWIRSQAVPRIDVTYLSHQMKPRRGQAQPLMMFESKEGVDLDDLLGRQANVNRLLNPERLEPSTTPRCVVWRSAGGPLMVCYPADLERGVRHGFGGAGSCFYVQHRGQPYNIVPLVSPRFTRLLWHHWQLPWARPGALPPEHTLQAAMHPSHVMALTQPRMSKDGMTIERSSEGTRAVIELYRSLGYGRSQMKADVGATGGLLEASGTRLGDRILIAAFHCHGQTIDRFFDWDAGITGGQLAALSVGKYGTLVLADACQDAREQVRPAPVPLRVRHLVRLAEADRGVAAATLEVVHVHPLDPVGLPPQPLHKAAWHHDQRVSVSLGPPHQNLPAVEVQVPQPQRAALADPHARAVEQPGQQLRNEGPHRPDDLPHLVDAQHGGTVTGRAQRKTAKRPRCSGLTSSASTCLYRNTIAQVAWFWLDADRCRSAARCVRYRPTSAAPRSRG